jgi:hypothetical protein
MDVSALEVDEIRVEGVARVEVPGAESNADRKEGDRQPGGEVAHA